MTSTHDGNTPRTPTSSQAELPRLEALALEFLTRISDPDHNYIQDRKYQFRTFQQCFLGSDAVTILVDVLAEQGYRHVSRAKAVELGRDMCAQYGIFCHVTNGHLFKDEKLFYRLDKNLPCQVAAALQALGNRAVSIMALIEQEVDVRDRVYHFRTYENCFIGREAVDTVLRLKLAIDRVGAVQLLLNCNQEIYTFEHVTRDHDMADAYLFYRFIPAGERMLDPRMQFNSTMAAMYLDAEMGVKRNGTQGSSNEFSVGSEMTDDSLRSSLHSNMSDDDAGSRLSSSMSSISSIESSVLASLLPPNVTLQHIADRLERDIEVKDNRYHFKVYRECFIAKDAVTYMVKKGYASSRSKAELIGRQLEAQLNLFRHVTNGHHFRDKGYFFRFTPKEERRVQSKSRNSSLTRTNQDLPPMPKPGLLNRAVSGASKLGLLADLQETESSIDEIGIAFERGMKVGDRIYHLKTYHKAFTGSQAVKYLVSKGFAHSRHDAVLLGRILMDELDLFVHVTDPGKELADCPMTLYQLTPIDERKARVAELHDKKPLENIEESEDTSTLLDSLPFASEELRKKADPKLLEVAALFRQGVKIKHHRYRGKTYPNTFIGSQAVDFLVNSSLADDRRDAIRVGRRIMHELQTFDHVKSDHDFADDYKFYRFEEHRQSGEATNQQSNSLSALTNSLTNLGKAGPRSIVSLSSKPTSTEDFAIVRDFLPLEQVAAQFRKNIVVKDRRYRFSTYKDVFIGSEAVDYMVGKTTWASSRQEAVQLGQTLMRELELFQHVTRSHTFRDEMLFYAFTDADEKSMLKRLELMNDELPTPGVDSVGSLTAERLVEVAKALEMGLKPEDHRFHLRVYKGTLVGSEIITFMIDSKLAATRADALRLGRAVCKQFLLLEHVTMDHLLKDSGLFYRIVPPANRIKGEWLKGTYDKRLRDKMVLALTKNKNFSIEEYWNLVQEVIENDNFEVNSYASEATFRNFHVDSSDIEWTRRVRSFEDSVHRRPFNSFKLSTHSLPESGTLSRTRQWSSTFIRLDPRQQIHRFYNEVAQTGASILGENDTEQRISIEALRPLFRFLPVNLASVFTVWRPTSYDAIRKMMTGEAVGKGLDIKGKSAKRGKLSGFVPFLQINENKYKQHIRRLSPTHMVRVFYKAEARRARDAATAELERVLMDMLETVKEAKRILADDKADKMMQKHALESMLLDVTYPMITPIDDYAPSCYGIEMPERLFWEAFFVRQDCTRKPGSIYDSGRPSQPAFQDMNFAALRAAPHDGAPKAVIYQNADREDPMNPCELLMAYEEQGRVLPVVSDFDCFLVGTRRVQYSSPLPPDQMEVLKWCIHHIEKILKRLLKERENGKKEKPPWSLLWLEVLKKSSFHPEIPRFGFGDPTSYGIVASAVDRLSTSGAVRHGAECFNYYFPQDLDDQFLFVSESIGDNQVPWKYVDVNELQDVLAAKIDDGFCFPLNVKWILMDPGWMNLYQKQLSSPHPNIIDSMKIWFPPESGIRDDIARIYELQRELRKMERMSDIVPEMTASEKSEVMRFI